MAQFVNVELRSVNDHVGKLADGVIIAPFLAQASRTETSLPSGAGAASRCSAARVNLP